MSNFILHTFETAPAESQPVLEAAKAQLGMVPNLFYVMAEAPSLLEGYLAMHNLAVKNSFDGSETTVIWQTINVDYGCHYCVPQHTAIGRMMGVSDEVTAALRNETPLPDAKLEALRSFTLAMVHSKGRVSQDELGAFFEAGYSKRHVLEIVQMIAHKVMSNYTNHLAQTPLDPMLGPLAWERTEAVA